MALLGFKPRAETGAGGTGRGWAALRGRGELMVCDGLGRSQNSAPQFLHLTLPLLWKCPRRGADQRSRDTKSVRLALRLEGGRAGHVEREPGK